MKNNKALIGVRIQSKHALIWAGAGTPDPSVIFWPQNEGSNDITVHLADTFGPSDQIYVFLSALGEASPPWADNLMGIEVLVEYGNGNTQTLTFNETCLVWHAKLEGVEEVKTLNWQPYVSHN